ncbi:MAG: hypothetical protein RLZZ500_144 [Bacteroidota bacterium]|jgi:hypothetical protein
MKLYCLAANALVTPSDLIVPSLEQLALFGGITNVYQTCADMEELEQCLTTLIYEDRQFKSYRVLYFVLEGADDYLAIDGSSYSLTEMAELFEGRLTGKMIHFANTKQLEMDTADSQYFLDVTGAQSISGYTRALPILSTPLDCQFFALAAQYTDVRELTEALYQKHYAQCKTLGFELYY